MVPLPDYFSDFFFFFFFFWEDPVDGAGDMSPSADWDGTNPSVRSGRSGLGSTAEVDGEAALSPSRTLLGTGDNVAGKVAGVPVSVPV
jgi:hypothetical protein